MANNSDQFVEVPVFNQLIPKEGPRAVPFAFDFTAAAAYSIDLQNMQSTGKITLVQSVYVRNSGTAPVQITFDLTGQSIDIPPQSAGYLPVLVQNPPRFTVTSVGGAADVKVMLLNVPMPAFIWPLVTYIVPQGAGGITVQDLALEAAVSGGFFQSKQYVNDDADNTVPRMFAGGSLVGTIAAAGNTIILAAVAGQGFALTHLNLSLPGNAALAAPGNLTISLNRSGVNMFNWTVTLPAAAGTAFIPIASLVGLNYLSPIVNQALQINLTGALVAGQLHYNVGAFTTSVLR